MLLSWLKRRRRRNLIAQPFPDEWLAVVQRNVHWYWRLSPAEQDKLQRDLRIFAWEKNWEGCGGLVMTDEIRVTTSAQICLMVLGFEAEYFDAVQSILVYPTAYVAPDQTITKGGLVLEGDSHREGEAWYRGPVILSWADALAGARGENDGNNLVLHEFAHQLDMQNGREIDGTPRLASRQQYQQWKEVMSEEFQRLQRDCRRGRATLPDCYGAIDMGEFFAVATECFFQQPAEMQQQHPRLFALLSEYYRQNPAKRLDSGE